jgi:hypothetical protein
VTTVSERSRDWGLARDLWLTSAAHSRSLSRSLFYTIPIAVLAIVLYRDLFAQTVPYTSNAHAIQSLDTALNAYFCGEPMLLSGRYSPQAFLTTRPDLLTHRFRIVLSAMTPGGTLSEYCRTLNQPVVVSENSLMWLERLALAVDGRLTPGQLGASLAATRVTMLLIFAWALLRSGTSLLLTAVGVLVGCDILRAVEMRDSIYPFVLTLPLLSAALYGFAATSTRLTAGRAPIWAFACAMGVVTGFSASMRTVMLPVSVAMFGLFLFAASGWPAFRALGAWRTSAGAIAAYVIGYAAYAALFIYPLHLPASAGVPNATYHTVSHQLVLGLAVPENDLSRSEGLEWNDEIGFKVARRMEPGVLLYGAEYDAMLFRYYRKLWREQPRAMLSTYFTKLRSAGVEVFLGVARIGRDFGVPPAVAEWLHRMTNGLALIALAFGTLVLGFRRYRRRGDARHLMLSFMALAALAALAESFLTYSLFVGMYFSELLFFVLFLMLFSIQAGLDALASASQTFGLPSTLQPGNR